MTYTRLLLIRDDQTAERTYGTLYGFESGNPADEGTFLCYTLEEPWRENQHDISCIPAGTYKWRKYVSSKHGLCFAIDGVPNRDDIRIHIGNTLENTKGCVLCGKTKTKWGPNWVVAYSRPALRVLLKACAKTGTIEIVDGGK